jgi:hypothetical protein
MHVVIQVNLHVLNHVIEVNDEMMNLKYQFDIEIDVQLNRLILYSHLIMIYPLFHLVVLHFVYDNMLND